MERDGWEEEEEREHINNIGEEGKREGAGVGEFFKLTIFNIYSFVFCFSLPPTTNQVVFSILILLMHYLLYWKLFWPLFP